MEKVEKRETDSIKMEKPQIIQTYDLLIAANVCNQELREVIKRPSYSLAHVSMAGGNISLFHSHEKMTEVYFMIEGEGVLYVDSHAIHVQAGDCIEINPKQGHKLKNAGKKTLEHLVIATPPFNPEDVHLLKDSNSYNIRHLSRNRKSFAALDGAIVEELNTEKEREQLGISLALGTLSGGRTARHHHHKVSEEIYYVLSGSGKIYLNGGKTGINKGTFVFIPPGVVHALENPSEEELKILCIASPPYKEDDFILD